MTTPPLVLVADEPRVTRHVAEALSGRGSASSPPIAGRPRSPSTMSCGRTSSLLDLALPDLDGFEVMRQLQERRQVPIVLLSSKGSTADKARGLDLGADDYLAKPFQDEELAARVRAILRRTLDVAGSPSVVGFDDVEIDLARRLVTRGGKLVHLSRTEWLLLSHLAANAGRVVLHGELLTKVWGPEYREDLGYLRVWVSRVRRKLGTPPGQAGRIRTFQGIGYLLDIRDPSPRPA